MNLVIDTNVLVESITARSPYHKIFDEDDNKFVDCAICGNSDLIITSDHHFNVLKDIDFPKVEIIAPGEFINQYMQIPGVRPISPKV